MRYRSSRNFGVLALYRAIAVLTMCFLAATSSANDVLWSQLREGGKVVLIRHALTPSQFGDPPDMRFDDCASQRNLTDAGREQAKRIGLAFAQQQVKVSAVRSSRLCRCIDTAQLAFGQTTTWDDITSITQDTPARRQEKAQSLKRTLATAVASSGENLVLVTHNFNIQDATGISIAMGEALVIAPKGDAGFEVLGKIAPP